MNIIFNELAICGKFDKVEAVAELLLRLYASIQEASHSIVVTRGLLNRPALSSASVHDAILKAGKTQRTLLLSWLANNGPFTSDELVDLVDNLWWYDAEDVTDYGLGEAAKRIKLGLDFVSYSPSVGCDGKFDFSPIVVIQGLLEEPVGKTSIINLYSLDQIPKPKAKAERPPESWKQFIDFAVEKFDLLQIDTRNCLEALEKHPFNMNVVRRSQALMGVLNEIAAGIDDVGALSAGAIAIMTKHFQGEKSWFSDEEPSNPEVFWFYDNSNNRSRIYCSWHGKIKTPQFRIHFQWPIPVGQKFIKVLYIGEKLTKS